MLGSNDFWKAHVNGPTNKSQIHYFSPCRWPVDSRNAPRWSHFLKNLEHRLFFFITFFSVSVKLNFKSRSTIQEGQVYFEMFCFSFLISVPLPIIFRTIFVPWGSVPAVALPDSSYEWCPCSSSPQEVVSVGTKTCLRLTIRLGLFGRKHSSSFDVFCLISSILEATEASFFLTVPLMQALCVFLDSSEPFLPANVHTQSESFTILAPQGALEDGSSWPSLGM